MGGLFSSPSVAETPPPPPTPTREDPSVEEARKAEQIRNKKARGFASTLLFEGDEAAQPLSAAAQLLRPTATQQKLGGGS